MKEGGISRPPVLHLLTQRRLESVHAVGLFPSHAQLLTTHVAVGRQLAVDGLAQIQIADDGGGAQVKDLLHSATPMA